MIFYFLFLKKLKHDVHKVCVIVVIVFIFLLYPANQNL